MIDPVPRVVIAIVVAAMASPAAAAEPEGWTLDVAGDRAGVSLGPAPATWWSGRVQLTHRRDGKGGAFVAVEPLRRFSSTDLTFIAGAWRHAGAWSFYAEAAGTPRADFHYRWSGEAEAYRRVAGAWAAHAAYRYWAYPGQSVHLVSPRVTRYGARSELHARLSLVRNATHGTRSESGLVRGHFDVRPRLRLGGGVAVGERIFDVTSLPREPAPGWVAFAEARVAVRAADSIGLLVKVAEESSTFDQTAFGLSYRRTF
jgi:YaiO family outer membrane protein